MVASLANNVSIKEVTINNQVPAGIKAICERNKQSKFKKVVKILVVGEARVGKTSFVKSLKNEKFEQQQSITRVTEVSTIQWQQTEESHEYIVESKVFDFGGQEIFNFIHPIFQTSQHAIVVLVANIYAPNQEKQIENLEEIKNQIANLKSFYEEILLALTCFDGSEDHEFPFINSDDFGLAVDRVFRISNKERSGIESIKNKITKMLDWPSVGWTISGRCAELAQHFGERNKSEPMILNFNERRIGIENDLVMLHNSGWIFRSKDKKHIFTSDSLITKMFQGLFRIPGNDFTEDWEIEEVRHGVISERKFSSLFTSLLSCVFNISNGKYMEECCLVFLEFLESFSVCWRVQKRTLKGTRVFVMLPSLLPPFLLQGDLVGRREYLWKKIENKRKAATAQIRRKVKISEHTRCWDGKKVMDFIFPRLMVKLWDEMIDLELCWCDKFVLRGELHVDQLSIELENVENVLIVTRQGNEIDLECIGSCFGILAAFGDELEGLVEEYKDCFGVPRQVKVETIFYCCQAPIESFNAWEFEKIEKIKEKLEIKIACEACGSSFSGFERMENVWDELRFIYLLKATQKEREFESLIEAMEQAAGELIKFPINKITTKRQMKMHVEKRQGGMIISNLRFHRLLGEGAEGPVYQCCIYPIPTENLVYQSSKLKDDEESTEKHKAEWMNTMVGKYMACKIGKASESNYHEMFKEDRSTKALRSLLNTLTKMWINPSKTNQKEEAQQLWSDLATQFEIAQSNLLTKAANIKETSEQLRNFMNALPSSIIGSSWDAEKEKLGEIFEFLNELNSLSNQSEVLEELFGSLYRNEAPAVAFERARKQFTSREAEVWKTITQSMTSSKSPPIFTFIFSKAVNFWATNFFRKILPMVEALCNKFKSLESHLSSCPDLLNFSKCLESGNSMENSKSVMSEILKTQKMLFHKNELQILEELENNAKVDQTHIFLCSTLHSFAGNLDARLLPDSVRDIEMKFESEEPVVVDLMNIFDGTLSLIASERLENFSLMKECQSRLLLFYQVCLGVQELKYAKVAHKDIKLANILINKRLGWACISDFGLAIRYAEGGIALPDQQNLELCGVVHHPPEIALLKEKKRDTPVDKIDVFCLGSILAELIINPFKLASLSTNEAPVLDGLIALKEHIEKQEYAERLDIGDLISIVAYFLLYLCCYRGTEASQVLRVILKSVEPGTTQFTGAYRMDVEFLKKFILLSTKNRFSIGEKIIIEILLGVDLIHTRSLVQARLAAFCQSASAFLAK